MVLLLNINPLCEHFSVGIQFLSTGIKDVHYLKQFLLLFILWYVYESFNCMLLELELQVVGNHHLVLGLEPRSFAKAALSPQPPSF